MASLLRAKVADKDLWKERSGGIIAFLLIFIVLNLLFNGLTELLYSSGHLSSIAFGAELSALLSMSFSLSVFYYLYLYKREKLAKIISGLGLGKSSVSPMKIAIGLLLFAIVALLELMVTALGAATGISINSNVATSLASSPLWFYVFIAIIAPINEEILFRGFLVPRIGIVASSILFALGHLSYNSSFGIEVIAALIFGLVSGYVFKKTGSLYPSIIAHILVNVTSLILIFVIA
jgi:membrane protease YdiL (CAAX protease family)